MIDNNPLVLRQVYFDAWQKALNHQPLSAMEAMIVDVIERHPEYHTLFSDPKHFEEQQHEKFAIDHNPFFHLALHVAIAEQVGANRPIGITHLYKKLLKKMGDKTATEHKMIECLAKFLVMSFNSQTEPHERLYLEAIKRLL